MIKKLYKSSYDVSVPQLEFNEGQLELLYSHEASSRCPSLGSSSFNVKEHLLARGMKVEEFEQLKAFFKGISQQLINNELRKRNL